MLRISRVGVTKACSFDSLQVVLGLIPIGITWVLTISFFEVFVWVWQHVVGCILGFWLFVFVEVGSTGGRWFSNVRLLSMSCVRYLIAIR